MFILHYSPMSFNPTTNVNNKTQDKCANLTMDMEENQLILVDKIITGHFVNFEVGINLRRIHIVPIKPIFTIYNYNIHKQLDTWIPYTFTTVPSLSLLFWVFYDEIIFSNQRSCTIIFLTRRPYPLALKKNRVLCTVVKITEHDKVPSSGYLQFTCQAKQSNVPIIQAS